MREVVQRDSAVRVGAWSPGHTGPLWRANSGWYSPGLLSSVPGHQPPPPNKGCWLGEGTVEAMDTGSIAVPQLLDNFGLVRSQC